MDYRTAKGTTPNGDSRPGHVRPGNIELPEGS